MTLKAKVLVDNIPSGPIRGEWGLSIFIEYNEHTCLLDVGATSLFAENAEKYGINLKDVEFAALSHAHYDHAGGMKKFFEINPTADFYLQKPSDCYLKKWIFHKYIGIPKGVIEEYQDRIRFVEGDRHILEGIDLIAHHTSNLEAIGTREKMYQRTNAGWRPDDFSHEQSLVFDTPNGLVIFNSCSHGGAVNIIHEVSERFPGKTVYGYIGGLHLFNKSAEEVRTVAKNMQETGIQYLCTGHCTGTDAYDILKEELGDMLHQLHVGLEMDFE